MTLQWGKNHAEDELKPSNFSFQQIAICRAAPPVDYSSSTTWAETTDPSSAELLSDSNYYNDYSRSHIIFQYSRPVLIANCAEQKPLGSTQSTHHSAFHKRSHVQSYKKGAVCGRPRQRWDNLLRRRVFQSVRTRNTNCGRNVYVSSCCYRRIIAC